MSRRPVFPGGTRWLNVPLPKQLADRLLATHGSLKALAVAIAGAVVAANGQDGAEDASDQFINCPEGAVEAGGEGGGTEDRADGI